MPNDEELLAALDRAYDETQLDPPTEEGWHDKLVAGIAADHEADWLRHRRAARLRAVREWAVVGGVAFIVVWAWRHW